MNLVHFAQAADFEPQTFAPNDQSDWWKPVGLWVSDEDGYGWSQWCAEAEYPIGPVPLSVKLKRDARILHLASPAELDEFTERFGTEHQPFGYGIRWFEVAREHQGILITPYHWTRRMNLFWYYGWDCASGCIWDKAAIASIGPLTHRDRLPPVHRVLRIEGETE